LRKSITRASWESEGMGQGYTNNRCWALFSC